MKVFFRGVPRPIIVRFMILVALACIPIGSLVMASESGKEELQISQTGIESADWKERRYAVQSIEKLEHLTPRDLLVLQHALKDPSVHVRRAASNAVLKFGKHAISVLPTLLNVLANKNEDSSLRWNILDTLKKFSHDNSTDILRVLRGLISNSQEDVVIRFKTMSILKEFPSPAKSLIPILRQLAKDSKHQSLQNQAWLTLAHLEPHNDEVIRAIVEIAKGQHGTHIKLQSGVLSTEFNMPRSALRTLLKIDQGEKVVPIFFESLKRQAKEESGVESLANELGLYLQEHKTIASKYIPGIYEIVQRQPDRDVDYYVRFMFLVTLVQLDPTSPQLKEILQNIVKSDGHPNVIRGAEELLKCIDPTISKTQKNHYPCYGHSKTSPRGT